MMQQLETVTHHLSLGGRTGGAKLLVAAAKIELIDQTPLSITSFFFQDMYNFLMDSVENLGVKITYSREIEP